MDLPALHGVNGPVGATRVVAVGVGELDGEFELDGVELGVGLAVCEGLGVGAANAGLARAEPASRLTVTAPIKALPARVFDILLTN